MFILKELECMQGLTDVPSGLSEKTFADTSVQITSGFIFLKIDTITHWLLFNQQLSCLSLRSIILKIKNLLNEISNRGFGLLIVFVYSINTCLLVIICHWSLAVWEEGMVLPILKNAKQFMVSVEIDIFTRVYRINLLATF